MSEQQEPNTGHELLKEAAVLNNPYGYLALNGQQIVALAAVREVIRQNGAVFTLPDGQDRTRGLLNILDFCLDFSVPLTADQVHAATN